MKWKSREYLCTINLIDCKISKFITNSKMYFIIQGTLTNASLCSQSVIDKTHRQGEFTMRRSKQFINVCFYWNTILASVFVSFHLMIRKPYTLYFTAHNAYDVCSKLNPSKGKQNKSKPPTSNRQPSTSKHYPPTTITEADLKRLFYRLLSCLRNRSHSHSHSHSHSRLIARFV